VSEFDLNSLLSSAMQMQSQMADAQQRVSEATVVGASGGGKVSITMQGDGTVTKVAIDPSVVDPAEVELLEDLVIAAFRDAGAQVSQLQSEMMSQATGGLDLGGFGGLLGPGQ
jgi:nucleoid-associated protein EbfC